MKPVEVYVAATGNAFMTDIASWLVEAAALAGRDASLVTDRLPADPGVVNVVVAPHEFFVLHGGTDAELNAAAARSVLICTEQPGTPWFAIGVSFCRPAAAVFDINANGVDALQRLGIDAHRLPLGGVPSMVADPAARDLDVLFLGGDTDRRRAVLATLGPVLWSRHSELRLFRFTEPVHGGVPGLVFGRDKYALLARARILVNVHRDDQVPGYFEWARIVEAMANGTTVVTEPSAGFEPLRPGTHFVATDDIAGGVAELLDDPERCTAIGKAGAVAVLDEHPLSRRLAPVFDQLDGVDLGRHGWRTRWIVRRNRPQLAPKPPLLPVFRPAEPLRQRVYHALLAEQRLQRGIESARCQLAHGTPHHDVEFTTPAFDHADEAPEVSVVVTLYNYADVVTEALDSVAASHGIDTEIVVVDDHSTDTSRDVVRRFMAAHPDLPVLLLGRESNGGLPQARNLGIARARADKVMILDADNAVYPTCLRRLADALDADPGASFAYATLQAFGAEPGLRSHLPWHVPWLCAANYLDAQALIRRDVLVRHGGYREDEWIYGWEDWDLWLRLAVAGEHAVHLPEMLGRYRTQRTSMISMSNLAADAMRAHLVERYPTLPWPT
jgi:Glycosyl transferase family 2/Glycosyl transferases group 1